MIQIRQGVFETNSSSTHSITMCMKYDYDAWVNGEVYFNDGWWYNSTSSNKDKDFLTRDEVVELIKCSGYYGDEDIESLSDQELAEEWGIYTPYTWDHYNEFLESYEIKFITPNGDEVVAFGVYGHD